MRTNAMSSVPAGVVATFVLSQKEMSRGSTQDSARQTGLDLRLF
jgi:hypothetical protein